MRKPDAVLLSIGGNDVGFAPSIAWATMPSGHRNLAGLLSVNITNKAIDPVCPKYTGQSICQKNKPVGRDRIKYWLPDYYKWLAQELQDSGLVNNPGSVFLTAYPNPSYIEDGQTFCDKDRSRDLSEQARSMLPRVFTTSKWDIGITKEEIEDLNTGLITPLFHAMNNAATEHGWNFVSDHIAEMKKHGICAGYSRTEAKTPIYPHIRNGVWYPENPSTILAYDLNRQRWFRNTNDSVLFQAQKTGRSINGAFHPDFRAHALIADHLYAKILKYWDQNNDSFSGAE
ncbi:MAG: hypothetical protein RBT42_14470 [Aquabacterium sp.]|jgi:lysophospholipase L1-like esterase|uniref:hypothetical protein n=1 Tax=Aquabacterium sp. TaxID=1872578 RepID=UPI002A359D82|nr:hypothetical protein [Aquabacterium sp.]MDX9844948.1 hypothetical protein [Aquabacterium sp.]